MGGGEFQIISCSFRSFYIQFLEDDMSKPITPLIAADIIIELIDIPSRPIVLIERSYPPYGSLPLS